MYVADLKPTFGRCQAGSLTNHSVHPPWVEPPTKFSKQKKGGCWLDLNFERGLLEKRG